MRRSVCVALALVCSAALVLAAPAAPRRAVSINFAGLFSGAGASALLAPTDNIVQTGTAPTCSPPSLEQTEVNINFDGLLDSFSEACDLGVPQLRALCATGEFRHNNPDDALINTMPGLCRNSGETGRHIACVQPGGLLDVQVELTNLGTGTWPKSDFVLELAVEHGDFPDWDLNPQLKLTRNVKPGEKGVFAGMLRAPETTGRFNLSWQLTGACGDIGETVFSLVEVTCSDGIFCNGAERYVDGKCVAAARPACDDLQPCTRDMCDEDRQRCSRVMLKTSDNVWDAQGRNMNCSLVPSCKSGDDGEVCVPNCAGRVCGGDGCGGVCGSLGGLCANRQSCTAEGTCVLNTAPGSCQNPYPLLTGGQALLGRHTYDVNTALGLQSTAATCNPTATAGQIMVSFTVPTDGREYVVDARMSNGIDAEATLDTVLELREGRCFDPVDAEPAFIQDGVGQNVWCSDDATPPGGVGSRIVAPLKNGATYYFIAGGYNAETVGPATLDLSFVDGYTPFCMSRYCGPDGGGGVCGVCPAGTACDEYLRCSPAPTSTFCTTDHCKNEDGSARVCGKDGCGGFCGSLSQGACPSGELCVRADGSCQSFTVCDNLHPTCAGGCGAGEYCATDCKCHAVSEPLADLVLDSERLVDSVLVDFVEFDNITCAWHEGCVTGTGIRKLLRFDTTTVNQGAADMTLDDPSRHPEQFTWGECHNHPHFMGYAEYRLLTTDGTELLVARGHKTGYCMQDSNAQADLPGPTVSCRPLTTCEAPGISAGWSDVYGNDIDCQWIDITDVAPGDYMLRLELNVDRKFLEETVENNVGIAMVTITADGGYITGSTR